MSDLKVSSLVALSVMASQIATLPISPALVAAQIDVPVLPEETDGSHYVTIPPDTAGTFKWPYYQKPRIVIINECSAPITVRLGIDEGACVAQIFRGTSSHYLLRDTGAGNMPGGGSGEHKLTISDDLFKKQFPGDFATE